MGKNLLTVSVAWLAFGVASVAAEGALPVSWDMDKLYTAPPRFDAPVYCEGDPNANPEVRSTGEGVKALFYAGLPWQGNPTRVFAWLGLPETGDGKVPGMVLVHGGGGTAFDEWVRVWNRRGYAAIAMDLTGTRPGGKPGERPRHEWGGPGHVSFDEDIDRPVEDQWLYHAVADVALAHSLLRSLPEVDAARIGLTGISWGGFLTCIVSAVDTRFRFAVPVYGCGYHDQSSSLAGERAKMGPERAAKWVSLWDPSGYLVHTTMPTLWITGSNDFFSPLDLHARSSDLVRGPRTLSVHVGMPHSHVHGWAPEEIYAYADSQLKGSSSLACIRGQGTRDGMAWVQFEATTPIVEAVLVHAGDIADWTKCPWQTTSAAIDAAAGEITAAIPGGTRAYFFNLQDERGLMVSTRNVVVD
ncbi:MAG TPA: acetylxylan esterase [Candidatus Hydrogenedentes bacterium]|nr:acetylxylan esterase [Candidatus Hydrogenedentota bacterium]HPG65870.1 acetylxylan esterase [Candidatus Hydrogenedentota bacterium]